MDENFNFVMEYFAKQDSVSEKFLSYEIFKKVTSE